MIDRIELSTAILPGDIAKKPHNAEQAAEQFAALFLQNMLRQMRKVSEALAADDSPCSTQQRMINDLYDDHLALHLASQANTGIAQMILKQIKPSPTE